MNIAIVTNWFPAGAGYVSKLYRETLEIQGAKVFIYARGGKQMIGDPIWDDENITWVKEQNGKINNSHFLNWLKRKKIDTIFFNEQRHWTLLVKLKQCGFKIGAYVDYYTQKSVPAFQIYDFLICNTKRHFSVFNRHKSVSYIPWGTDINKFAPVTGKKHSPLNFLISAGWQLSKNADRRGSIIALEAFIKTKGNASLFFYSQVPLDQAPKYVVDLVNSDRRVKYIFGTFEPFPFHEGDIYLYPSRLDGIGLTVPEALSSGLAVITTNSPPMNEFVTHGFNGFLVNVEKYLGRHDGYYWAESLINTDELVDRIQYYIDNPDVAFEHQGNSRKHAEAFLDWYNNTSNIFSIFSDSVNCSINDISHNIINLCLELDSENYPGTIDYLRKALISIKLKVKTF